MATIGNKFLDLIDLFKRQSDDKSLEIATIIELLKETNAVLDDAVTVECNRGHKHLTTVRTGLPDVTWGQLYKGIPQSKSETAQVEDTTGFVEALSTIDKRLLELSAHESAVRLSEAKAFLESLSQEVATKIFYGNVATDPDQFTGLAPRFNDLSAPNGGQIVDAVTELEGEGEGEDAPKHTSIWFVTWGDNYTHLLYPKGTKAGITREDKGEQRVTDSSGNAYYVKEELFRQHVGLTVRDWRQVVRVANIDVEALATGSYDIYKVLRKGYWKLKSHRVAGGNTVIYCNSDVLEALDASSTPTVSTSESYVRLRPREVDGFEVMTYRGMPVRQVDALVNTEGLVS